MRRRKNDFLSRRMFAKCARMEATNKILKFPAHRLSLLKKSEKIDCEDEKSDFY
jgi:hypothetical protein